jgi:hypothetical protein
MLVLALIWALASADLYMHHPRGSNNRLNEQSAERNNGNRLFDSQNNNRGGYNVGDKSNMAHNQQQPYLPPGNVFDYTTPTASGYAPSQYQYVYFEQSTLQINWANQHGCGGNEGTDPYKLNCAIMFQYMCDTTNGGPAEITEDMQVILMDGGNTNTPDEPNTYSEIALVATNNNNNVRGRHESEAFYFMCKRRQRNFRLFHADQNLNGHTSQYTRQNNNGNRRGLECPEERDYYPWWNPTPWVDVAYLTTNIERCANEILGKSQNTNNVCYCDGLLASLETTEEYPNTIPIDSDNCAKRNGTWKCWNKNMPAPECKQVEWSRINHLGNGRHGQMLSYNWTLPKYSDLVSYGMKEYTFDSTGGLPQRMVKCVGRLRYNMTTDDYDPFNITSELDDREDLGIVSPIRQNPTVDIGSHDLPGIRLALNTNQYGRTFQDRTHVFYIAQRPALFQNKNIINLNVHGKRGNVVQTYPSVVYDFNPNRLTVPADSLIHVQWTGSNTHNNGNPAGDGQAGDAGLGMTGTDRHNFVQIRTLSDNYPMPLDKNQNNPNLLWANVDCYNYDGVAIADWVECSLVLSTSGQLRSKADVLATTRDIDPLLNDAPASLVGGVMLHLKTTAAGKEFSYMSTRNNYFSHRSQKGLITVV